MKKEGEKLQFSSKIAVSEETKDLLRKLLKADPNQRLNWKQFFTSSIFQRGEIGEKDLSVGTPKHSNGTLEEPPKEDFFICKTNNYNQEKEFESNSTKV